MGTVFSSEELLRMDYQILQKYMDAAVLRRPKLIAEMKRHPVSELIKKANSVHALSYLATVRCICAFIGIADPIVISASAIN